MRLPCALSIAQIKEACEMLHAQGKKIYVAVNALLHNDSLNGLEQYLTELAHIGVDAIEFADPAVYLTAKETVPHLPLHWNAEVIATSAGSVSFWEKKGIKRAVLARELNMDEILDIKQESNCEIEVQIHGAVCMFHSKRELLSSYFEYHERKEDVSGQKYYLREEKRRDELYPVFEDRFGTHIFTSYDVCILRFLDELIDGGIDSFRIESLLKPAQYNEKVLSVYRRAIDLYLNDEDSFRYEVGELMNEIEQIQNPDRPLTTGFYFKELIY
jgi:putative protease